MQFWNNGNQVGVAVCSDIESQLASNHHIYSETSYYDSSADSVRFMTFGPSLTGAVTFVLSIGGDSVSVNVSAAGLTTISYDE